MGVVPASAMPAERDVWEVTGGAEGSRGWGDARVGVARAERSETRGGSMAFSVGSKKGLCMR